MLTPDRRLLTKRLTALLSDASSSVVDEALRELDAVDDDEVLRALAHGVQASSQFILESRGGRFDALPFARRDDVLLAVGARGGALSRAASLKLTVRDLTPLARLPAIETLRVTLSPDASIRGLEVLGALPRLRRLSVSGRLEGLAFLAGATSLQELELSYSRVGLDTLPPLPSLESLTVDEGPHAPAQSLAPLAALPQLRRLHLSRLDVTDLSPLASLVSLESLALNDTPQPFDLSPLAELRSLRTLAVTRTLVRDLTPLARRHRAADARPV